MNEPQPQLTRGVSMAEDPPSGTRAKLYEQINEAKSCYWFCWIYPPQCQHGASVCSRECAPFAGGAAGYISFPSSTAHLMKDIMVWVGRRTVSRPFWWTGGKSFISSTLICCKTWFINLKGCSQETIKCLFFVCRKFWYLAFPLFCRIQAKVQNHLIGC